MEIYDELKLTEREFQVLRSEMESHKRSVGIAYVLLFFTGAFGGHKFYLGKWVWGISYTALACLSILLMIFPLMLLGIFLIYDLITLPKQIEEIENDKKQEIINKFRNNSVDDTIDFLRQ